MDVEKIIKETVYTVMKKQGKYKGVITPETLLVDDLKADSLAMIELMLELEEKFDISIDEDDISKIQSIGDIYEYVKKVYEKQNSSED